MEENKKVIYYGVFFDKKIVEDALKDHDFRKIENPHITFKYMPEENEIPWDLVGKNVKVKVVGFGMDEKAAGWLVEIPEELKSFYHGAKNIHITTTVSEIGKPVDTGNIQNWGKLYKPFYIKGRFDVFYAK